ncbi:sigma-70 family RNA polymerase sigma factor [Paracoccus liaowanqingii]|uniref:sigma-70 family RNA polymerase sigma factor n=1 Tax=Paracoccus liaowanqingii TaxID=2560053 RepID=UPI001E39997B|nr:sigma-70 family RNA polymerase sigma factor [Paracoccus liaowanqingii]
MTQSPDLAQRWHCPAAAGRVTLHGRAHPPEEAALDGQTDWDLLLARANSGDAAAFLRLLTKVTPPLRCLIRARGRGLPPDLHEDILQEVLLAIHLKRQSWAPGSPVRPWLYAVARHKVVDAFRRRGRRVHLPIEDVAEILASEADPAPLAAHDADRMLGMIDARSAALVRAVRLEGHSTEEAAQGMGLTAGAARVALHRAMKRLSELAERMK